MIFLEGVTRVDSEVHRLRPPYNYSWHNVHLSELLGRTFIEFVFLKWLQGSFLSCLRFVWVDAALTFVSGGAATGSH